MGGVIIFFEVVPLVLLLLLLIRVSEWAAQERKVMTMSASTKICSKPLGGGWDLPGPKVLRFSPIRIQQKTGEHVAISYSFMI